MLDRLYNWTLSLAAHPHALWALALVSAAESSFFPIPPDVLLAAIIVANRDKAWQAATICTAASVVGGVFGYGIGALAFEALGVPILNVYGYLEKFEEFRALYNEHGAWVVLAGALTPIPYKVITVASGVFSMNLLEFTVASLGGRGFRFLLVAALLWQFGPPIRAFVEGNLKFVVTAAFVLLIGGFVAVGMIG